MKKDTTVAFNPNDPSHLKGFRKWIKKMTIKLAKEKKNQPSYFIVNRKLWNKMKKFCQLNEKII